MTGISRRRSFRFLLLFLSISLQFLSGLSDDSSSSKDGTAVDKQTPSSSGTGSKILIICLVIVGFVSLSFFLFKFWQKKKREEQYARLLKLFEQDDELELELGLRDWAFPKYWSIPLSWGFLRRGRWRPPVWRLVPIARIAMGDCRDIIGWGQMSLISLLYHL